ncbi:hypothetical protein Tco_0999247 [Tanacetum coccineum]
MVLYQYHQGYESDEFRPLKMTIILPTQPDSNHFMLIIPDSDIQIQPLKGGGDIPVDVPNILLTHPALQLDFDFIPSNDIGSDLNASAPSEDSNKIYDPGICIEKSNPNPQNSCTLSPEINTLLLFSSENEDKVFNHGVLAYKEKSPPSRGLKASKLSLSRKVHD